MGFERYLYLGYISLKLGQLMKGITLIRSWLDADRTMGILMDEDGPFALTLEDPWKDNQVNISCIPAGKYLCKRVLSAKFGDTFTVKDVPDRKYIRFHKGNTEDDTHGCILIGEEFGILDDQPAILNSGKGFKEFMDKLLGINDFLLNIRECR